MIITLGLILSLTETTFAEDTLCFEYEIVKTTETVEGERFQLEIPVYRVVLSIDSNKFQEFQNYSKQVWLDLISKEETCHKACLVLYAIYEKDAEIFLAIDEKKWFAVRKSKEFSYWLKVL